MIKQLKLLGVALAAIFALTAAAASVANAVEISTLPTPSEASPLKFTFKSNAGEATKLLTLGGKEIACTSVTGIGSFTSVRKGPVEFKFVGCTGPLGVKCTGLEAGDKEGEILFKATFHLRHLLINNVPSEVHLVILVGHIHFTCFGILFLVLGCVGSMDLLTSGSMPVIDKLVSVLVADFLQTGGDPGINPIDNDTSTAMEECVLLTKEGTGGTYESSGQLGGGTIEGFEQGGKPVTILIHLIK